MPLPSRLWIALALAATCVLQPSRVWAQGAAEPPSTEAPRGVPPNSPLPAILTLDDALRLLHERGLDLLMADAAVRTAEGNVQTSTSVANPSVSVSDGPILNYSAQDSRENPCIGCSKQNLSWSVGDNGALVDLLAGKRGLRVEVARAAVAAARKTRADAERNLAFLVKQQYVQAVVAAETLDLTLEIQKTLAKTLTLSRLQYPRLIDEGGLARIEVQKLEGDQAVSSAVQSLRAAKVGLAFLLGARNLVSDFDVDRLALRFRVPAALKGARPDTLLREALERRPDVAALGYQRLRAGAAVDAARWQQLPTVSLSVNYNAMGLGQNSVPYFAGQAQANLPVFYHQEGEIRRARADVAKQALLQAKAINQVASDVDTAFASFVANRELVERMEGTLVGRATMARDIVEKQYRGGSIKLTDFLDAERTYIATKVEYLTDLGGYWTALFALEQAVGTEFRQ
jgi:outer membrane protein TolC